MTWTKAKTGTLIVALLLLCGVTVPLGYHWGFVRSGKKPSQLPGFRYFKELSDVGFGTPEAAFQTFQDAMKNQGTRPIDSTRMKELWNLPDDFDDPNARYSIDIGQGIGRAIGYRVVSQEQIASNQVRLIIDYERPYGSSFRREKVLTEKEGQWRVQPVRVTRGQGTQRRE